MNEHEYMNITDGIDERYITEYQDISAGREKRVRRRIRTTVLIAALVAIMIPAGVYAVSQLTHRENVSIYYSEDGVQMLEDNLLANGYTVENGQIRLTVDVEMCDGDFTQGVYTLTALTEDAKAHLDSVDVKLVYADTGEWIYPVGGGSQFTDGDAMSDGEISTLFIYPIDSSYIDNSRPVRMIFFENAKTGESDGFGDIVVEDYTYYEGIYFDLLTEANIPTKTLQSADGNKITLTPYGVSRLDEDWAYPDDDLLMETPVNSVVVISTDGERTDIMTLDEDNGTVTTDLDRISLVTTGDIGSGNFTIGFGTILNVENISGVEINGVSYTE